MAAKPKLDLTPEEFKMFGKAFEKPEFRDMFFNYAQELSDPKTREDTDLLISQLDPANAMGQVDATLHAAQARAEQSKAAAKATGSSTTATAPGVPALKKGFLPAPSLSSPPAAHHSNVAVPAESQSADAGSEPDAIGTTSGGSTQPSQATCFAQPGPGLPSSAGRSVPAHTLSELHIAAAGSRPDGLLLSVELPLLTSMAGVDLDVSANQLQLQDAAGHYTLDIRLPYPVDEEQTEARFDKASRRLSVRLSIDIFR
eukprot:TRINITY_DN26960_c0_g1_i1.p1 TRINITY_DN26960_c0_g1~~TRINITY_DN26960_c0_g1_i1.p1  ORF type:complete len:257 (-),score=79.12 TRINITY_DN26960_c0_g1_i1:110-880(-)